MMGPGPKLSQMPMSMPATGGGSVGSPAFMPGPGAMGSGQGALGADAANAASNQQYLKNARQQHLDAVAQSRANTSAVAGKFGIGQSGGPRGQGIVPSAGRFGTGRMPMPSGGGMSLPMLSDRESKQKIRELEGVNDHYRALLGGETDYPTPRQPDMSAAYRAPSTSAYEYKDPSMPGAAPGTNVGPMTDELKGIPGVVRPGPGGYEQVDPARLTMANTSQLAQQRRELDDLKAHLDALGTDEKLTYAAGGR